MPEQNQNDEDASAKDETPGVANPGEYALDLGDDLLAEALDAVEKRLYRKNNPAEEEIEFEVELPTESAATQRPSTVEMKLVERIEALQAELNQAQSDARTARDEGTLALKKAQRKAGASESLKLELEDARSNARSNEQLASELRTTLQEVNEEARRAKTRQKRELEEAHRKTLTRVCKELLPVLDNLGLATEHVPEKLADDPFVRGLLMTVSQLEDALGKVHVQRLGTQPGDAFDPELHEAIASEPHPDIPRGHIISVLQVGYQLEGRLLRAARVTVCGDELGATPQAEE